MLLLLLMMVSFSIALAPADVEAQQRRGAFALHYGPALTDAELEWYGRFDVLVTHDVLPREQAVFLHGKGTKLFFYEWAAAFYATKADEWERSLVRTQSTAVLNAEPLRGGVGSPDFDAFYFDPANARGRTTRAALLARRLRHSAYDGIFFDTTRFESVHPLAREEYLRRHPKTPYDVAFSSFLRTLKRRIGRGMIFTNQGFQDADNFLRWADFDLSESFVTRPSAGGFQPRPWNDPRDRWNSSRFIFESLIEPAARRFSGVRMAHLNYIAAHDPAVIHLVVAAAHLFGGEGYVVGPSLADEQDPIYFWDPGKPVGARIDANGGDVSYRFFQNGIVIVNGGTAVFTLETRPCAECRYENVATGEPLDRGAPLLVPGVTNGRPTALLLRRLP